MQNILEGFKESGIEDLARGKLWLKLHVAQDRTTVTRRPSPASSESP
jgi:hypothetical protein